MRRFLTTIALSVGVMVAGLGLFAPLPVLAGSPTTSGASSQICQGISQTTGTGGGTCKNDGRLTNVVRVIVNLLSVIIGIVAVIMVMVAGFKYITAGGDSSSISSAKTTLVYAIVGLVIVALSQAIVRFVLNKIG